MAWLANHLCRILSVSCNYASLFFTHWDWYEQWTALIFHSIISSPT